MNHLFYLFTAGVCLINLDIWAQGGISGSLEANTNIYVRDTTIGAANIPQYDNLLSGTDAWLTLTYNNMDWGLEAGARLDVFNNSNLIDPTAAFTGIGLGRLYVVKNVGKLTITGGHFYDQIGTGIIFRAYEERPLAIDNAILGIHARYQLTDNFMLKAFTGKQKDLFSTFDPIVKGVNAEGFKAFTDKVSIAPGIGFMNRTLDPEDMNNIVNTLNGYPLEDRFIPHFNVYAFTAYNRLNLGNFSFYAEGAYKTDDIILNQSGDMLVNRNGTVLYGTASYNRKGLGTTLYIKRTENFPLRTSPFETFLDGQINFLPPLTRQNAKTLTARYNAATQELGELAFQIDITKKISDKVSATFNAAYIDDLDGNELYRELHAITDLKWSKKLKQTLGLQYQHYNEFVYRQEGLASDPILEAWVPYTELVYKFDRKHSLRGELQYLSTEKDFGSWLYGLLEFSIAPNWSFSASDMYNIDPKKTTEGLHYYSLFSSYSNGANRFSLSYVKQVEGVVCTGGICRFEPAFNGVKFTVNSTF